MHNTLCEYCKYLLRLKNISLGILQILIIIITFMYTISFETCKHTTGTMWKCHNNNWQLSTKCFFWELADAFVSWTLTRQQKIHNGGIGWEGGSIDFSSFDRFCVDIAHNNITSGTYSTCVIHSLAVCECCILFRWKTLMICRGTSRINKRHSTKQLSTLCV